MFLLLFFFYIRLHVFVRLLKVHHKVADSPFWTGTVKAVSLQVVVFNN